LRAKADSWSFLGILTFNLGCGGSCSSSAIRKKAAEEEFESGFRGKCHLEMVLA
jgi:hypothetical protein